MLDTATDIVHLGLVDGSRTWVASAGGGAQASVTLLPAVRSLLDQAGLAWGQLDAIAFGRGPGAFTGLRTACSVTQGLALACDCPVLALDTLMAIAEDARQSDPPAWQPGQLVWVVQDARMDELYVGAYRWSGERWLAEQSPALWALDVPAARWPEPVWVAGNALVAHPAALQDKVARAWPQAAPRGGALAELARQAWARGETLDAALALPLYVRDKVAQTTAERLAGKAAV